ncbi:MAG: hypothetical protein ACXVPQ_02225 [Bacteroidia bacterium]
MKKNIELLDSSKTEAQFLAAAMGFEKMAKQEKKEWLPEYYAGLCYIHIAFEKEGDDIDKWADKAELHINRADSLSKNNAEIYVLKAMSSSSRIMVDPMTRGFQYGKAAYDFSQTAMSLDPTNPRPFANKAQGTFYTPETFGGGAAKAKPNVEKALALYKTFKPASAIHPNWGKAMCEELLKKCNEN